MNVYGDLLVVDIGIIVEMFKLLRIIIFIDNGELIEN